jgi:hypothetical protein
VNKKQGKSQKYQNMLTVAGANHRPLAVLNESYNRGPKILVLLEQNVHFF